MGNLTRPPSPRLRHRLRRRRAGRRALVHVQPRPTSRSTGRSSCSSWWRSCRSAAPSGRPDRMTGPGSARPRVDRAGRGDPGPGRPLRHRCDRALAKPRPEAHRGREPHGRTARRSARTRSSAPGAHLRLLVPEAVPLALEAGAGHRRCGSSTRTTTCSSSTSPRAWSSTRRRAIATGTMVHALLGRQGGAEYGGIAGVAAAGDRPSAGPRHERADHGRQARRRPDRPHGPAQGAPDQEDVPRPRAGPVSAAVGRIEAPIGRDPRQRTRMAVVADGRPSVTGYRVRERFDGWTLLELDLITGRTHQIRVHLDAIGHPVAGDPVYGTGTSPARTGRAWSGCSCTPGGSSWPHRRTGTSSGPRRRCRPPSSRSSTALARRTAAAR